MEAERTQKTGNNKEISHSKQINKQTKQVAGRKWKAVVSRIATIYYVKYLIFNKKLWDMKRISEV